MTETHPRITWQWREFSIAAAAMLAICALVLIAATRSRYMLHDSFWIDLVWTEQFAKVLQSGTLYPRWMPETHGGLGSPVFYFYPPLAFYISSGFVLAGLSAYNAVIAAFAAALLASGVAMYAWLREISARPLAGAVLYMALPYHMTDFFTRGALAEFVAFIWVPLIAIGVRRAARERRWLLLAISYACLILTHLPMALLVSIFLVAPLALIELWRDRKSLAPLVLAGATGLGLAAVYLIPMLALQPYAAVDTMIGHRYLSASNYAIYRPGDWPPATPGMLIISAAHLWAVVILARSGARGWLIGLVVLMALIWGALPGLWSLPLLERVQFPWRALLISEFLLVTAGAIARATMVQKIIAFAPALLVAIIPWASTPTYDRERVQSILQERRDVIEYLPAGAGPGRGSYSPWALKLARERGTERPFAFPAWQVSCPGGAVKTGREPSTGLLTWEGKDCSKQIVLTPAEKAGWSISLLTLVLLVAAAIRVKRSRPLHSGSRIGRAPGANDASPEALPAF